MPLQLIKKRAAEAVTATLEAEFDYRPDQVVFEVPPRRDLGDLAWPGALPLAKVLRRPPRQIAETIAEKTLWPDEVARVEIAVPGFLNLFLKRDLVLSTLLSGQGEALDVAPPPRTASGICPGTIPGNLFNLESGHTSTRNPHPRVG